MSLKPDNARSLRISHPKPPAPLDQRLPFSTAQATESFTRSKSRVNPHDSVHNEWLVDASDHREVGKYEQDLHVFHCFGYRTTIKNIWVCEGSCPSSHIVQMPPRELSEPQTRIKRLEMVNIFGLTILKAPRTDELLRTPYWMFVGVRRQFYRIQFRSIRSSLPAFSRTKSEALKGKMIPRR